MRACIALNARATLRISRGPRASSSCTAGPRPIASVARTSMRSGAASVRTTSSAASSTPPDNSATEAIWP